MNVFISWRGSDRTLKNTIVERLRQGLDEIDNVWESDAGCASDFSEDCIAAIRQSQVFVVLVSDSAMEQSYVTNEVVEAHECELQGKLNMVVYKLTDAPYSPKLAGHLNHISDVHYLARASGKPADASVDALLHRVKHLLSRRKQGNPEKPADVLIPILEGTSVGEDYFVPDSRNEILSKLENCLAEQNIVFLTGLDGYGRKALARQYARLHQKDYDTVVCLPFFKGNLRDFFIRGIQITNLSESVFDQLSEEQHLLKKAAFLQKLNRRTLIIVPELTVEDKKDPLINDILAGLSCHILFVTQALPSTLSFPAIPVGRMENEYLRRLFFHHYPSATEEEQAELAPTLDTFIDAIEGHTQAIEIAATALSEEIGIYPEDLPGILESIRPQSDNPLADRIFGLISDLFDISRFIEEEKKILLVASILATLPFDEKEFVAILKSGSVYSAEAIRKLAKHNWLTLDRQSRTVSIDALLSDVCRSHVTPDRSLIALVARYLAENSFFNSALWIIATEVVRSINLFELLSLPAAIDVANLFLSAACGQSDEILRGLTPEELNRVTESANEELERLDDEELRYTCGVLVRQMLAGLQSVVSFFSLSQRIDHSDLTESAFFSLINDEFLNSLLTVAYDDETEESPLGQDFASLVSAILSRSRIAVVTEYHKLCRRLSDGSYHEEAENLDVIGYFVICIGHLLVQSNLRDNRLALMLCRDVAEAGRLFGYPSPRDAWVCNDLYFYYLLEAGEFGEELDETAQLLLHLYESKMAEIFSDEEEAQNAYVYLTINYALTRYFEEDYEEGNRILDFLEAAALTHPSAIQAYLDALNRLVDAAVSNGDALEAVALLEKALPAMTPTVNQSEADPEGELHGLMNALSDILLQLKNPITPSEDHAPYLSYYEEYASQEPDKKRYRLFCRIAEAAEKLDYSALTAEAIADKAAALKKAAMAGKKELDLAPEAFALVSEAGYRILGFRHHYVQYIGGAAIADGLIAEMQNGEGKTYTILLAAFLHTLYGRQVHILDSSAYLSARNFANMRGVLEYLGCTVAQVTMENNGNISAWGRCDVLYGTFAALSLARLKVETRPADKGEKIRYEVLIADEADYALVDEGTKDCAIVDNKNGEDLTPLWRAVCLALEGLSADSDDFFSYNRISGKYVVSESLYKRVEAHLGSPITTLSATMNNHLNNALQAAIRVFFFSQRDKEYFVVNGSVYYENTATGELYQPNPVWRYFLSYKEKLNARLTKEETVTSKVISRATIFDLIQCYDRLSGTTATARSVSRVFKEIYGLDLLSVPTNKPVLRTDHQPILLVDDETKQKILLRILESKRETGQPVIIITPDIAAANGISRFLKTNDIAHALLTAMNSEEESELLGDAGKLGAVTVTTAMANRGVDVMLGGNPFTLAKRRLAELGFTRQQIDDAIFRVQGLDEDCRALRERYLSLVAYFRHFTGNEKLAVEAAGGLSVIGTECFKDLRVEQQIRGRAGRQGSLGESYMLYSLDDPSVKAMMSSTVGYVQNNLRAQGAEAMDSAFLMRILAKARRKLQENQLMRLSETPKHLYFKEAHAILLGTVESVKEGKISAKDLFESRVLKSKTLLKTLTAGLKAPDAAADDPTVRLMTPFVDDPKSLNEAKLWQIIHDAFTKMQQNFSLQGMDPDRVMNTALIAELQRGWSQFIQETDNEIASADLFFVGNYKKKKAFLLNYATTRANRILDFYLLRLLALKPSPPRRPSVSIQPIPVRNTGTAPNDPCPCGSGKKYKKCCGKSDTEENAH